MMFGSGKKNQKKKIINEQKQVLTENSPWPVQEAYKALRTNIIFSLPGGQSKVIGVTSAMQHDGKTINAVNMAISFSQLGKKVALVEGDLRLPSVSKKVGCKSVPGLTNVLAGGCPLTDAMRHMDKFQGLTIIPAGNVPPDPTWLLQSQQMKVLLDGLRKLYDYVFIDLPPVTTVADALILAPLLDGYLLVVRDQETEYRAVADTLDQLRLAKAKVIGAVYNGAGQSGNGRYYKHGYYR